MKTSAKEVKRFTTDDIGLSAALITGGFPLLELSPHNRIITFVFKDDPALLSTYAKYVSDSLSVKARSFYNNLRSLKSTIHMINDDDKRTAA